MRLSWKIRSTDLVPVVGVAAVALRVSQTQIAEVVTRVWHSKDLIRRPVGIRKRNSSSARPMARGAVSYSIAPFKAADDLNWEQTWRSLHQMRQISQIGGGSRLRSRRSISATPPHRHAATTAPRMRTVDSALQEIVRMLQRLLVPVSQLEDRSVTWTCVRAARRLEPRVCVATAFWMWIRRTRGAWAEHVMEPCVRLRQIVRAEEAVFKQKPVKQRDRLRHSRPRVQHPIINPDSSRCAVWNVVGMSQMIVSPVVSR